MSSIVFSKKSDEWQTPEALFDELDAEFGPFDMDVAASASNAKCSYFITREMDALSTDWMDKNWCNPPYSQVKEFARRAAEEQEKGRLTVMLIPARTDTAFFHDYIYRRPGVEIRFIRGRIKFINPDGPLLRGTSMNGSNDAAPFASMLVIFHPVDKQGLQDEKARIS